MVLVLILICASECIGMPEDPDDDAPPSQPPSFKMCLCVRAYSCTGWKGDEKRKRGGEEERRRREAIKPLSPRNYQSLF